jgi:hypothetical protein
MRQSAAAPIETAGRRFEHRRTTGRVAAVKSIGTCSWSLTVAGGRAIDVGRFEACGSIRADHEEEQRR